MKKGVLVAICLVSFLSFISIASAAYCGGYSLYCGQRDPVQGYCQPGTNTCIKQGNWECNFIDSCQTFCAVCDSWEYTPTYTGDGRTCMTDANCAPVDNAPFGGLIGVEGTKLRGWAQDSDCSGSVTPSSNNCPIDVHIYFDGPAGSGATIMGTTANLVYPGTNKDNFAADIPTQFLNGQPHTAYLYMIGKDKNGANNGNNPFMGTLDFNIAQTCSSFTYSGWDTCWNGFQFRSVTSSSPAGCTGGNPVTQQSCQGQYGNYCYFGGPCAPGLICSQQSCKVDVGYTCTDSSQCANGLYCKTSTGKCTDPNNEHLACSGNSCTLVPGAGSASCSIDANCQQCSYSYGGWGSCSNGQQTRSASAGSPSGCAGSPVTTQSCIGGAGNSCQSDSQCSSGLICSGNTCQSATCSSFSYSSWSTCSNGQQSRTVSSSSPAGCTGGSPTLTQSCTGGQGNNCQLSSQCNSGLECRNNVCQPPVCSYTYGSWGSCSNGQQTRSVTSATPTGCAGTPSLTQSCTATEGNTCQSTSQCNSGLYCKTSTGKCTDPNNEHLACSANTCTLVAGSGSNSCSIDANCQQCSFSYSSWSTCSNGQQTRSVTSATPTGCAGTPTLTQSCTGGLDNSCQSDSQCAAGYLCSSGSCKAGNQTACTVTTNCAVGMKCDAGKCTTNLCAGITCNSPPNSLCYTTAGTCSVGSCSYTPLPAGTACGTDQVCNAAGYCGISQPIQSAAWNSLDGRSIFSGESYDTFKMAVSGSGISGRTVQLKVYRDEIFDSNIYTVSSSNGYASIQINTSGDYYFIATVVGSPADGVQSSTLTVSSAANNAAPTAKIAQPIAAGIYFSNSPITLTSNSTDSDDSIASWVWSMSDGGSANGEISSYTFTSDGEKTIHLRVTDSRGSYSDSDIDVLVLSTGSKISPYIAIPQDKQIVVSDNLVATYSAVGTYAVQVNKTSTCTYTVTCLAGSCPSTTQNVPTCVGSGTLPIQGSPKGYNELEFNWTFKEGGATVGSVKGVGKVTGSIGFSTYGSKNVSLYVRHVTTDMTASVNDEFLLLNQRQCSTQGNTWYAVQNGFVTGSYDTLSTNYCAGLDTTAGTRDDCCPAGYYCSTGTNPGCKLDVDSNGTLKQCNAYNTAQSCNDDPSQRVKNDPLWDFYNCGENSQGNNIICACSWQASTNSCVFASSARETIDPTNSTLSSCSFSTTTGGCVDGYQTVTITATKTSGNDPLCVDSTQILPCGRPVIALPFFGGLQVIITAIVLVLIYFILSRFVSRK